MIQFVGLPASERVGRLAGPLKQFLQLFFPQIHAVIDWSKGYEALDKELHEIIREAVLGSIVADKLFRVFLQDGTDTWILIHVEVQSQPDTEFPLRMFTYHYRIRDRYNRDVVSLAVLGDDSENWRPNEFEYARLGCEIRFRFPVLKLLDWRGRTEELENSANPIAVIALAHLESLATNHRPRERYQAKRQLIRRLFERGWDNQQIRELFRLVDWLLDLPADLQQQFRDDIHKFVEERRMPFITSFERLAREEGHDEGVQNGLRKALSVTLKTKFGEAGLSFAKELEVITDPEKLLVLHEHAITTQSVEELRRYL